MRKSYKGMKRIKRLKTKAAAYAIAICLAAGGVPITALAAETGTMTEESEGGGTTDASGAETSDGNGENGGSGKMEENEAGDSETGEVGKPGENAGADVKTDENPDGDKADGTGEEDVAPDENPDGDKADGTGEEDVAPDENPDGDKADGTGEEDVAPDENPDGDKADGTGEEDVTPDENPDKDETAGGGQTFEEVPGGEIETDVEQGLVDGGQKNDVLAPEIPLMPERIAPVNQLPAALLAEVPDTDIEPFVESDDDGRMGYHCDSWGFKIFGRDKEGDILSSSLGSYDVRMKPSHSGQLWFSSDNMDATYDNIYVAVRASIVQIDEISYVRMSYYVTNKNDDSAVTFSLGTTADTCIGHDDGALVRRTDDGILMLGRDMFSADRSYIYAFSASDDDESAAPVDRWWFGYYGDRYDNVFSGDEPADEISNIDSGMTYAWVDQELEAGETEKYSVLFGIGDINDYSEPDEPDVPDEPDEPDMPDEPDVPDVSAHESSDSDEAYDDTKYWSRSGDRWTFDNGNSYRNQWGYLYYNGNYSWYHFDRSGNMETGWFAAPDGNRYYLNPVSDGKQGQMCTGWKLVDDKWYYFSQEQGVLYGSLLVSTTTPDGYTVDENGVWIP